MQAPELSIAAVLEHYGADLARVSEHGWRSVRCPFTDKHTDKRPSGRVNLALNAYCCLACGTKGDAIKVIREIEGLDFQGAVQFAEEILGQSCGDVRKPTRRTAPVQRSQWRDTLFG